MEGNPVADMLGSSVLSSRFSKNCNSNDLLCFCSFPPDFLQADASGMAMYGTKVFQVCLRNTKLKGIGPIEEDQPALMDGIMMMKVKQVLLKNEFQCG
ncbi:hypothetical protein Gogos_015117, partial [Gossypium gossypioides]|nr:hypothetical protein [Gossypium gossypioides]